MRLAIHSIAWGHTRDLRGMLREIKAAGYSGVEFFQHPDDLGGAEAVLKMCKAENVEIVGTCAGSWDQRLKFVEAWSDFHKIPVSDGRCPYIYVDDWDESLGATALQQGFRVALHPHMYTSCQTMREADVILAKHPSLLFLPDTAHISIAGDNPVSAIEKHWSRLAGIHLKGWYSDVGRSYQFYARGFCELGHGTVFLKDVLSLLTKRWLTCWIVVEQDRAENAVQSATASLNWLRDYLPPFVFASRN